MLEEIVIRGAREHNLKNIDVVIPRDRITVITGPSGSGKSSLALDTIYAEGQRRFVESLSAYARQFLDQMEKPDADAIEGLSPAIAIDQKTITRSPRSTVGTVTEIYDYMRVLYTRIGVPMCYQCGSAISTQDLKNILRSILSLHHGTRIQVLSPIVRERKGTYQKEILQMRREGFVRARIDGTMVDLTGDISLKKQQRHTIEIVIDRFLIKPSIERQVKAAIDRALGFADSVVINLVDEGRDILFSRTLACVRCGISYPKIEPMLFSFNSRYGACPRCNGLGIEGIADEQGLADTPFSETETNAYSSLPPCRSCHGMRLRKEAQSVRIGGKSIGEFARLSVREAALFLQDLELTERERIISSRVLKEIRERLTFIDHVGLGYLTLERPSLTLSGGEAQRIRLATQLGSSLTGVLYVLDEPSIGLHPRDCSKLLQSLVRIRDNGNTVIVVEHNEETIRAADHVIDMGPGAGKNGGWVTATGTPTDISASTASLTGRYLAGELLVHHTLRRRQPADHLIIRDASAFNLAHIDVLIPLGLFLCVTGVSGSGKSTLVFEILYKALMAARYNSKVVPGSHAAIEGVEKVDRVICVDQSPLGRTPRSNPATYTGIFTMVRNLFSQMPESRARGYTPSRFSFNIAGGRCEACRGDGLKKVEMHFLPSVYVRCDVCKGRRYNRETLEITYRDKTIDDVLRMTIREAFDFFSAIPPLASRLALLEDMGMGYLQMGQSATTLSGGEAQRLKVSRELAKKAKGSTLYILDEPTTGLHFSDITRLIGIINRLVDLGNTVIVIEHDLDIIASADHVIDLGPGGGDEGGRVVATGTPEEIARSPQSHTGGYLAGKLAALRAGPRGPQR